MDLRTEVNLLKGIEDIVYTSQKQHTEEINLLNKQHNEIIKELLNQSKAAETKHNEAIKEARKQVKYALGAFIVAILALIVTIVFGILQHTPVAADVLSCGRFVI